jgi:hypothetical protein
MAHMRLAQRVAAKPEGKDTAKGRPGPRDAFMQQLAAQLNGRAQRRSDEHFLPGAQAMPSSPVQMMKRSVRVAGGLNGLGEPANDEAGDQTVAYTSRHDDQRSVQFHQARADRLRALENGDYSVREIILEEVGGHSKEGARHISADPDLYDIYMQLVERYGLTSWIEPTYEGPSTWRETETP